MREEKVIHKDAKAIANASRADGSASASMVERVARAMCAQMGIHADDWHEDNGVRTYAWELEADTARAAIEAMREPTLPVLIAGCSALTKPDAAEALVQAHFGERHDIARTKMRFRWSAMIDQALK